jgi:hypothetical protein
MAMAGEYARVFIGEFAIHFFSTRIMGMHHPRNRCKNSFAPDKFCFCKRVDKQVPWQSHSSTRQSRDMDPRGYKQRFWLSKGQSTDQTFLSFFFAFSVLLALCACAS